MSETFSTFVQAVDGKLADIMPLAGYTLTGSRYTAYTVQQATAGDATLYAGCVAVAGVVSAIYVAQVTVTDQADETMDVDVEIDGTTCLSAAHTMDDDSTALTPEAVATIDTAADDVSAGSLLSVVLDYTAGAAATPMADTIVTILVDHTMAIT